MYLFGDCPGAEVYKFAVSEVPEIVSEAIQNAGLVPSDIDWLLLHQANIRIMQHAAKELGIPMEKVLKNIQEYGNTSAGWAHPNYGCIVLNSFCAISF